MSPVIWYFTLLALGVLLLIAEILIPGGIAGTIGALALVAAMGVGLAQFASPWGFLSAVAIVLFGGIALLLWIQLFPRSRAGKRFTLRTDGAAYRPTTPPAADLQNATGESVTALRPAGIAVINGKRYDVLAEGGEWIPAGASIQVRAIHDGHLVVGMPAPEE